MRRGSRRVQRMGFAAVTIGAFLTLLAACEQPAEQTGGGGGDGAGGDSPSSISIATGTTSGVFYPIGGAMAEIINNNVEGVSASSEATGASVENVRLLEGGQSDVIISQGDVVYQAVNGEGDEFAEGAVDMQVLMVLYPNVYHAVSLQSINERLGLECFSDVAGHRFSVGAAGSGNELATNLVFEAVGLSPADDINRQRLDYAETATALRDGNLDAGSWVVGEGHGTLLELEATDPIHLIPICADEQQKVIDKYPFYTAHTISADTYSTLEGDVETIALWNVVAVSPDLSEEAGYELAKALYDNVDFINKVYEPGAQYLTFDTLANSPAPLHPGLIKYAEEQGATIPDELRP